MPRIATLWITTFSLAFFITVATALSEDIRLDDLLPSTARQGWGTLQTGKSVQGNSLSVGGKRFSHGLGTHAVSEIIYDLDRAYGRFRAWVGVDDEMKGYTKSSVVFLVFGDGRKLFASKVMRIGDAAMPVNVSVSGVDELKLVVTDAGDGIDCDHADWADAIFLDGKVPVPKAAKYSVSSATMKIDLSADGEITGALGGCTRLQGCRSTGPVATTRLAGGGYAFTRQWADAGGGTAAGRRRCTVTDRFLPAKDSIRWEVEIVGGGSPWTTVIETCLNYPATPATRFWTAWSDPENQGGAWRDPLVLRPLGGAAWTFGGSTTRGDYTALPLATIAEPARNTALSVVFSPEDTYLVGARLATSPTGAIRFSRVNFRIGSRPICFAMDLIAHEADWRGGLRWLVARYPQFVEPPNPLADGLAGCGAYSGDESPIDAAKLRKMAFRINWKLSDDFPYMGMFLPPVKDAEESWERSCDETAPPDKPRTTNCRRLNDYACYMKANGFYVLNYFNVTEFGKNMDGKPVRA